MSNVLHVVKGAKVKLINITLTITFEVGQLGMYRIHGIIGESNIWQYTLTMQLARFLVGGLECCMERNPYLQPK